MKTDKSEKIVSSNANQQRSRAPIDTPYPLSSKYFCYFTCFGWSSNCFLLSILSFLQFQVHEFSRARKEAFLPPRLSRACYPYYRSGISAWFSATLWVWRHGLDRDLTCENLSSVLFVILVNYSIRIRGNEKFIRLEGIQSIIAKLRQNL